jgi:hypothetical protein
MQFGAGYRQNHGRWVELGDPVGYRSNLRNPPLYRAIDEMQQGARLGEPALEAGLHSAQFLAIGLAAAAGLGLYLTLRKS